MSLSLALRKTLDFAAAPVMQLILIFPCGGLVVLTPNGPGGVYGRFGGTWCLSSQPEDRQYLPSKHSYPSTKPHFVKTRKTTVQLTKPPRTLNIV